MLVKGTVSDACCWCENYEHKQHRDAIRNLLVVFDEVEARADTSGIYGITTHPYYTHNYFHAWLDKDAIERLGDLPNDLANKEWDYPVGHLCCECEVHLRVKTV